jgi:hypothetical protein
MPPDPRTGGGSGGAEPGDDATDPITSLLDGVADSWAHAASGVQRSVEGTYTVSDVLADVMECSIRASRLGIAVLRGFGVLPPATPPQPNPTTVTVDVPVDPSVFTTSAAGPLRGEELRAIGFGHLFKIPAGKVHVGAPALRNGLTTVRVSVDFTGVSNFERKRTIIYEGTITAPSATGAAPARYAVRVPKPAY